MTEANLAELLPWVGRTLEESDALEPFRAAALAAALDRTTPLQRGDELPPVWHWLYFLHTPRAESTREDGHPAVEGGLLPPTLPPRRMWAASELHFEAPLILGTPARKRSTIAAIDAKTGRSGSLVFVHVEHVISQADTPRVRERQTLVYRPAAVGPQPAPAAEPAPSDPTWQHTWTPDPVLLFRYSALTYNSHRIHYDREYARTREHYAGLVVQGPLLASLLLELVAETAPERRVRAFQFRARRPAFAGEELHVCGNPDGDEVELWTSDATGALGVSAHATLASEL